MIITSSSIERPRISANQLGEYPFATPAAKIRMLTDQKFGNEHRAPYYHSASCAILRAFDGGEFDHGVIRAEIAKLRSTQARSKQHAAKLENNAVMLERFLLIDATLLPQTGEHLKIRRSAVLELDDVTISVRPEIITRNASAGFFSLTKFRLSQSRVSGDSSEIILLLLLKYAQRLNYPSLQLDPAETRLVDCFSRTLIPAHTLPRIREQQLQNALREIRRMWPTLRRPKDDPDPSLN
jgi:hypothetical protein